MARIFQASFENTSTTANPGLFDTITSVTNGTTHVKTGARAIQITSLSSGTAKGLNKKYQTAASTTDFLRVWIYIVTLPSADNQIMNFSNTSSLGSGQRCSIALASDGTLKLFNNTPTQIGSASSALSLNTWYYVELKCDTSPASGSRIIEGRLNGSVFATTSTGAQGTASSISIGGNLVLEAQTTGEWWFDDLALNNSTGAAQTGYPGSTQVWEGWPNAAGDANGCLVQVGGTVGSANNYTRVDEVPPDDATSYNATAVLNTEDLYTVDVSGVPTDSTVNVVMVGFRFADIVGADATTAVKAEIMKTSGGTKAQSADIIPNSTGWNSLGITAPRNYPIILYQDPDTVNWNPATWAPQIGFIVDAVGTRAIGITNIWISVDFTPSAGPPPSTSNSRWRMLTGIGL